MDAVLPFQGIWLGRMIASWILQGIQYTLYIYIYTLFVFLVEIIEVPNSLSKERLWWCGWMGWNSLPFHRWKSEPLTIPRLSGEIFKGTLRCSVWMWPKICPIEKIHQCGPIIATSHDLTPTCSCSWGREISLFQGNLGWWNIIIWPDQWIHDGFLVMFMDYWRMKLLMHWKYLLQRCLSDLPHHRHIHNISRWCIKRCWWSEIISASHGFTQQVVVLGILLNFGGWWKILYIKLFCI